jgi:protein deglycase
MPPKKILVPIADGSEEIETTCITDTLTRFGAHVTIASVMKDRLLCKMSRGIKVQADCSIEECTDQEWDLVVLPGGMPGAEHLRDSKTLIEILRQQKTSGKLYGAVCACEFPNIFKAHGNMSLIHYLLSTDMCCFFALTAPAVALAPHGLIDEGEPATCYPAPAFRDALKNLGACAQEDHVVVSGKLVTSQGPGTSLQFALQLGEELYGKEKRTEVAKQMLTL